MFGGAISWMSKKQVVLAMMKREYKYMEATHGRKEETWLHQLCSGIWFEQRDMKINCDSQSTIFVENIPLYHSIMNHIDVQYHFVRDMGGRNNVLLENVDTLENIANSLNKSVSVVKFSWCREAMGITSLGQ
jgi:hypothetical protein